MLRKGPLGVGSIIRSVINIGKGVMITNGMTLGGEMKTTMIRKGLRCWVYYKKTQSILEKRVTITNGMTCWVVKKNPQC
jgi:serine acetyltransferase